MIKTHLIYENKQGAVYIRERVNMARVRYLKVNSQLSCGMHTKNLDKSEKKNHILETDHPRALKFI